MTKESVAAVTGASGFLGRAVLERLFRGGTVRALVRRRDARVEAWERRGCEIVVGNLHDHEALARLMAGATVVYHCAATMAKNDPDLSRQVNVVGTENLARAAAAAEVSRLLYVSSISVFAATRAPEGRITEGVEPQRVQRLNCYGRTKYQGEVSLRRLARETGLACTIVRPTNIYGPGSGPWFHQFERMLRRFPFALGDLPIDVVYVDDVADAMLLAARSPAAAGATFHIGNEMVRMNRFILEVARVTGRPARPLPRVVDRVIRAMIDRGYRTVTGTHMSMSLVRPVLYPHALASATFGYSPRIGLREGFDRLAAWYRSLPRGGSDATAEAPTRALASP
jgi:2-alkyl-3-oxoalkanoate reductase